MRGIYAYLFWTIAMLSCVIGCAHHEREPVYSSLPSLASASGSSADRVYTTIITVSGGATGAITHGTVGKDRDADIADAVRKAVLSDPKLAPYPSKVTAAMDPNSRGKVILTGKVPTRKAKTDLVEHVRRVPGVTYVEDRLLLGFPNRPQEADPRS